MHFVSHTRAFYSRIRVNPILSLQIKAAMLLRVSVRNVHCGKRAVFQLVDFCIPVQQQTAHRRS